MYRISCEIVSLDDEKTYELCASYLNKKQGKRTILEGIDFVQSACIIEGKDIMKKLENIPLFENDKDFVRVSNVLVIVYIAHKIRVELHNPEILS